MLGLVLIRSGKFLSGIGVDSLIPLSACCDDVPGSDNLFGVILALLLVKRCLSVCDGFGGSGFSKSISFIATGFSTGGL